MKKVMRAGAAILAVTGMSVALADTAQAQVVPGRGVVYATYSMSTNARYDSQHMVWLGTPAGTHVWHYGSWAPVYVKSVANTNNLQVDQYSANWKQVA